MIGYTPTLDEQTKIEYIAIVFGITNCRVIKTLVINRINLNDFYGMAQRHEKNEPNPNEIIIL